MTESDQGSERGHAPADEASWRGRAQTVHGLLARTRFYPAAACTLLAAALLVVRWGAAGRAAYSFLLWNLFLAWLPWLFALPLAAMRVEKGKGWRALPLFVAWLLFLPNAPYLVTDLLHLDPRSPGPYWFDTAVFFIFAWTGCVLGLSSLSIVHARIERQLGSVAGWALVVSAAVLSGFGVYLGRFLRWNSWSVVTQPRSILRDVLSRVASPFEHPRTVAFTLLFAAFFVAAYGSVRPAPERQPR